MALALQRTQATSNNTRKCNLTIWTPSVPADCSQVGLITTGGPKGLLMTRGLDTEEKKNQLWRTGLVGNIYEIGLGSHEEKQISQDGDFNLSFHFKFYVDIK